MIFIFAMAGVNLFNGFYVASTIKSFGLKAVTMIFFLGMAVFMSMMGISLYILCERGLKPQMSAEEEKYRKMAEQMNTGAY